ncbi:hypothetical protein C8A00DRAFT_34983 [Chaetomidium leptoderma]|uniref:Uncharacterized protein n=1 Tax=Chaetomidium leptoderma TaxID=669021 RepID=A0AAN6VLC1_9PEZI|nr:hypothetical protein C8A00DRAFT_34983 [Chaetomidium leptoderma]
MKTKKQRHRRQKVKRPTPESAKPAPASVPAPAPDPDPDFAKSPAESPPRRKDASESGNSMSFARRTAHQDRKLKSRVRGLEKRLARFEQCERHLFEQLNAARTQIGELNSAMHYLLSAVPHNGRYVDKDLVTRWLTGSDPTGNEEVRKAALVATTDFLIHTIPLHLAFAMLPTAEDNPDYLLGQPKQGKIGKEHLEECLKWVVNGQPEREVEIHTLMFLYNGFRGLTSSHVSFRPMHCSQRELPTRGGEALGALFCILDALKGRIGLVPLHTRTGGSSSPCFDSTELITPLPTRTIPNGTRYYDRVEVTHESAKSADVGIGSGNLLPVDLRANFKWEVRETFAADYSAKIVCMPATVRDGGYQDDAVTWTFVENPKKMQGIPTLLQTAVVASGMLGDALDMHLLSAAARALCEALDDEEHSSSAASCRRVVRKYKLALDSFASSELAHRAGQRLHGPRSGSEGCGGFAGRVSAPAHITWCLLCTTCLRTLGGIVAPKS